VHVPTERELSSTHATHISEPNGRAVTAVVSQETRSTRNRRTTAGADVDRREPTRATPRTASRRARAGARPIIYRKGKFLLGSPA